MSDGDQNIEIDVSQVLKFFIRIRYFILWGVVGCGLIATLMTFLIFPPLKMFGITVSIDKNSLPAISESEKLIPKLTGATLAYPVTASMLEEIEPKLRGQIGFTGLRSALSPKGEAENESIRFSFLPAPAEDQVVMNASVPAHEASPEIANALIGALNSVVDRYNESLLESFDKANHSRIELSKKLFEDNERLYRQERILRDQEIFSIKLELAKVEYDLLKRAQKAGIAKDVINYIDTTQIKPANVGPVITNHEGPGTSTSVANAVARFGDNEETSQYADRVQRLLGALVQEHAVDMKKAEELKTELNSLILQYSRSKAFYSVYDLKARVALEQFLDATKDSLTLINRPMNLLPRFSARPGASANVLFGLSALNSTVAFRYIFGSMGFGLIAGIFVGALWLLVNVRKRDNLQTGVS